MASTNKKASASKVYTHGGTPAYAFMNAEQSLRRSVLAAFLFEDNYYEDGQSAAQRIEELSNNVPIATLAKLAEEVRHEHNLRHVSLLLLKNLIARGRGTGLVAPTIEKVVSRPDEITELLSLYWSDGKKPLAKSLKKGLAGAFNKFGAYNFAKYNRDTTIKLRDALFLVHPKPKDEAQQKVFDQIASNTLPTPDTWEVELSAGKDKKETFERLIREGKLGYFALMRNLRNMVDAGCDRKLVREAILARKGGAEKLLPFRYIAAARAAPSYEKEIDTALLHAINELPKLDGTTVVLVDVSGSMTSPLSRQSDLKRIDAACALASMVNGDDVRVFSFSSKIVEVPYRRGMAGVDAIYNSQSHSSTELHAAVDFVNKNVKHDRLIVITDEQATSSWYGRKEISNPVAPKAYMLNVANYQHGVGYGKHWTHIDGFSEKILHYIAEFENT